MNKVNNLSSKSNETSNFSEKESFSEISSENKTIQSFNNHPHLNITQIKANKRSNFYRMSYL